MKTPVLSMSNSTGGKPVTWATTYVWYHVPLEWRYEPGAGTAEGNSRAFLKVPYGIYVPSEHSLLFIISCVNNVCEWLHTCYSTHLEVRGPCVGVYSGN